MPEVPAGPPIDILLVEDNRGDILLTKEALKEGGIMNRMDVATDGEMAVQMLRQTGDHANARRPDLVLLDLNLPRVSGHEVLAAIKKDPALSTIPVIMLTTSAADEDVLRSYELHANAYITKPVELKAFMRAVRMAGEFYVQIVRLPPAQGEVHNSG